MRLALAQINTVVGDLDGNRALIVGRLEEARAAGAANPFGPVLPVAAEVPYRVIRVPGSWLVLAGGRPVLGAESRGKRLVPLSSDGLEEAVDALTRWSSRWPRGRIAVETWGDGPVLGSRGEELLAAAGFSAGPRRMTYRAPVR
jgi:ATP-dependent helicase Lhr and Lhr-like helicase